MQKDDVQDSYAGREQIQNVAERVTSQIESIPPDAFLLGAAVSVGASLLLRLSGRYQDALFVGQWAPTLLLVGIYSKATSAGAWRQQSSRSSRESGDSAMH
jgi:hypothetical protein